MIAERIAWWFEARPALEQIRLRNKGNTGPAKLIAHERELLAREPEFDEVANDVMRAIWDLGRSRNAAGRIPIEAIWAWCDRRGYRGAHAQVMTAILGTADDVFVAERKKESE